MIIAYNNYYSDACRKVIYSYFHIYICSLEFRHKEKLYLIPHLFIYSIMYLLIMYQWYTVIYELIDTYIILCVIIYYYHYLFCCWNVLALIIRNAFKLAPISFWLSAIHFWVLYFLALQNVLGLSHTFPALDLQSTISPGALLTFMGELYLETKIWAKKYTDFHFVITPLWWLLGLLSR